MKYQIKTFTSSNFHLLKEEWIKLEKGEDMTYYQSYHWYESIMKFMPEKKGYYGSVFLCIYLGDQLQLICPLWVVYKTINFVNNVFSCSEEAISTGLFLIKLSIIFLSLDVIFKSSCKQDSQIKS